ncbi:phosphoglycerate mutase [Ramlibacter sp. MAHUQ-53]|uniref:phosphoglycerate mutase n=1 Tax=unclassified Ramlibacter TaxID=2617605 RepID=UPI003642A9EB
MSDAIHLLIPFAVTASPGCAQALEGLALPALRRLLGRLAVDREDLGTLGDLSMPHERALARAIGLPATDGRIPWAAWQLRSEGRDPGTAPWAWLTPCHWEVGADRITMRAPQHLQLGEAESRTLMEAMQPYFEEDGMALTWDAPDRWLAQGEMLHELACASLERVVGAVVDDWLPRQREARPLRRLQQEMQMFLYTHPANEAREAARLPTVNSFWVSGAGSLPEDAPAHMPAGLKMETRLRDAALDGDWTAWTAVWREIDTHELPRLAAALDHGRPVTLTLCGERGSRTWIQRHGQRLWHRATAGLRAPSLAAALDKL